MYRGARLHPLLRICSVRRLAATTDGVEVVELTVFEAIDMCEEWDGDSDDLDAITSIIQSAYNMGEGAAVDVLCRCMLHEHNNTPALNRAKFCAFLSETDQDRAVPHILRASSAIDEAAATQAVNGLVDEELQIWTLIVARRRARLVEAQAALTSPPLEVPTLQSVAEVNPSEATAAPELSKEAKEVIDPAAGDTAERPKAVADADQLGEGNFGILKQLTLRPKRSGRAGLFDKWRESSASEQREMMPDSAAEEEQVPQ
ncbi:hypothetical protein LTR85_011388 [Meristemomyces frigidus]|nr:hypothetical protein LTR85_011388 [Meristemomyces frigidus]